MHTGHCSCCAFVNDGKTFGAHVVTFYTLKTSDKQMTVPVATQLADVVRKNAVRIPVIRQKSLYLIAVEAVQTILGSNPHEAEFVFPKTVDRLMRKTQTFVYYLDIDVALVGRIQS